MKPERCGDTIEIEELLDEMSAEQLKTLASLNSMCSCDGCRGVLQIVRKELEKRQNETKS
jgi:hypothetical protein